jgi:hypothetical protein
MENKNFEGFKPLSEDEEKKIAGGQGLSDSCAPIAQEMADIKTKIRLMEQSGHVPSQQLILTYHNLEQKYRVCESQLSRS